MSDAEEDEEICRICRCGEESDRPLFHPCICTGSIKFVHEDCLLEWLSHSSTASSSKSQCELCGHRFGFTPVYEPGAPSSLSPLELGSLALYKALRLVPFLLRFTLVFITWGIFIPISTCVMFRILSLGKLDRALSVSPSFSSPSPSSTSSFGSFKSSSNLTESFLIRDSIVSGSQMEQSGFQSFLTRLKMALEGGYYSSWGIGLCVSACIFLSFLTLISVVDFVREHDLLTGLEEEEEIAIEAEEDANDDGMDVIHAQEYAEDPLLNEFEVASEDESDAGDIAQERQQRDERENHGEVQPDPLHEGQPPAQQQQDDDEDDEDAEEQGGFMDGMDPFVEDQENNAGDLNVALDELLGLRGPGWVLFHNVLWLLTFNGLYLCVALFAPTTVGAVMLSAFARIVESSLGVRLLSKEDEAFLLRTLHKLRSEQQMEEENRSKFFQSQRGPWFSSATFGEPSSLNIAARSSDDAPVCLMETDQAVREKFLEELHWASLEIGAVLIGYITVAWGLASLYVAAKFLRDTSRNPSSRRGWNRIARVLKLMSRTFKVVIIVFLKMGVFPILLGVLLEYAGRDLVDLGPIDRFSFATEHPVFALMILWVAGITHMLVITVIVLELRDVLHPAILHGIIRPKDSDESLLRTVLEDPITKHMRRMALSCAIYTFLVWAFIYLPKCMLQASSYSDLLPFKPNLHYTVLEVQLPVELVCIHIGVLNLLDHGKDEIRRGIEMWFQLMCSILGLTRFLLPCRDPDFVAPPETDNQHHQETMTFEEEYRKATLGLFPRVTPSVWGLRICLISFFAWLTCLVTTFVAIAAPLFVGRATVSLLQLPFTHEPLVYGIGCIVLWRGFVGAYALKLHRAPSVVREFVFGMHAQGFFLWPVIKSHLQWLLLVVFGGIVSPWLFGVLIQLNVLMPTSHPFIFPGGSVNASSETRWSFLQQVHAVFVALAGSGPELTTQDVMAYHGLSSGDTLKAQTLVEVLSLSTSPLHEWMMGLVSELVLLQLLLLPDLLRQRELFSGVHAKLTAAMREMMVVHSCSIMLGEIVLPLCSALGLALVVPLVVPGVLDGFLFAVTGHSLVNTQGVIQLFRRASSLLVLSLVVPYVASEAQRTWKVVHDALRDEKYLIGKRLHNMEQSQRHYSQKRGSVF